MADDKEFLREIKDRFTYSMDAFREERDESIEDLEFLLGGDNQWDEDAITARKNRPRLTVNKLPKFVKQVTGDQRQNRPSIKCRPVDSVADPLVADIFEGHIRNIEYNSQAAIAYDTAFKQAVGGGYPGFWRIDTEYADEDSFDQDIVINPIHNAFTVYPDPQTIQDVYKGGLDWCFVTETITKEEFKKRYPEKEGGNFDQSSGEEREGWWMDGECRIAEYWYREPEEKTRYLLDTGETVDADTVKDFTTDDGMGGKMLLDEMGEPSRVIRERKVKTHKVKWCLVSGSEVLEGPKDVAGKYIRIVPVFGDTWNIKGQTHYKSLIRDSKDSQKMYNYMISQNVEMTALSPKVPYLVTPKQVEGFEPQWKNANQVPYPYLQYNPDPIAPPPQRATGVTTNPGYIQLSQQATEDLQETTGIYKAALGQQSNERSGLAIRERKTESDVGMFEFIDNLTRAIQFTGKILVDLIPKIYDTERTIRLLGPDGRTQQADINKYMVDENGGRVLVNDITVGKYDVYVTVGPSYTTQRQEAAEAMMQIIQAVPDLMMVAGDLVFKNSDWPGAEEISDRLRQNIEAQKQQQQMMMMQPAAPPQGQP
jgi:hypothetical protein